MDPSSNEAAVCPDEQSSRFQSLSLQVRKIIKRSGTLLALFVLILVGTIISPYFLKSSNIINILRQIAITGIVSVGMTFVILTSGIDLSVGSLVGVVAVTTALFLKQGFSPILVVVIGMGTGAILGLVNGFGISFGRMPAFIMTLGMMVSARGIAMTISNGQPISWKNSGTEFDFLGGTDLLGIPVPVLIYVFILIVSFILLNKTPFGRYFYAIGDSRESARLSGINIRLIEISAYLINGVLCGVAGLIWISRLGVGEPTAGTSLELDAIAMVVIGGTSISGGTGSVIGTFIGGAIIMVIANLLNLIGVSPFTQQIVKGIIIVSAVLLDQIGKKEG